MIGGIDIVLYSEESFYVLTFQNTWRLATPLRRDGCTTSSAQPLLPQDDMRQLP